MWNLCPSPLASSLLVYLTLPCSTQAERYWHKFLRELFSDGLVPHHLLPTSLLISIITTLHSQLLTNSLSPHPPSCLLCLTSPMASLPLSHTWWFQNTANFSPDFSLTSRPPPIARGQGHTMMKTLLTSGRSLRKWSWSLWPP